MKRSITRREASHSKSERRLLIFAKSSASLKPLPQHHTSERERTAPGLDERRSGVVLSPVHTHFCHIYIARPTFSLEKPLSCRHTMPMQMCLCQIIKTAEISARSAQAWFFYVTIIFVKLRVIYTFYLFLFLFLLYAFECGVFEETNILRNFILMVTFEWNDFIYYVCVSPFSDTINFTTRRMQFQSRRNTSHARGIR